MVPSILQSLKYSALATAGALHVAAAVDHLPAGELAVGFFLLAGFGAAALASRRGVGGLVRQLGSAEIVAQVALARTLRPVKKVVFMGMGEPAHNLAAVLDTPVAA